jgi:hypothetical protein
MGAALPLEGGAAQEGVAVKATAHFVPLPPALFGSFSPLCRAVAARTRSTPFSYIAAPALSHTLSQGEDPVLAGDMVAAEVSGIQSVPGILACVKHYVGNNQVCALGPAA